MSEEKELSFFVHAEVIKLFFIRLALSLSVIALVSSLVFFGFKSRNLEKIESNEYYDLIFKQESVAQAMQPVFKDMESFQHYTLQYLNTGKKIRKSVIYPFQMYMEIHEQYTEFHILSGSGKTLLNMKGSEVDRKEFHLSSLVRNNLNKIGRNEMLISYDFLKESRLNGEVSFFTLLSSVFDRAGKRVASIVLVVNARDALDVLTKILVPNLGTSFLYDSSKNKFYKTKRTRRNVVMEQVDSKQFGPDIIKRMKEQFQGQVETDAGLFTFEKLYPVPVDKVVDNGIANLQHNKNSIDLFFKDLSIVSFVPKRLLYQSVNNFLKIVLLVDAIALLLLGVILYFFTLTQIKQKYSEMLLESQREKAYLQSKMATLGELSAGIAHEINNPLTILVCYSEEVLYNARQDEVDFKTLKADTEVINDTAYRIAKVVKGLRSIARNADADPFEITTVQSIVEDASVISNIKLNKFQIELKVDEIDPDLTIDCRAAQISQIILNLINNAIDSIAGSEEPWIRIGVEEAGEMVTLSVTDSGYGIPGDVAAKLFDPFFTTKEMGRGTGLGLSISKKIIAGHNGKLVLNNESFNTQFCIILPKKQLQVDGEEYAEA